MRSFYQTVAEYLQNHLPLQSHLIRGAQRLHPEVKDQDQVQKYLVVLCKAVPSIPDEDVGTITDEWKVYRGEEVPDSVLYNADGKLKRIDVYWNHVLDIKNKAGGMKYLHLTKVVQTCLSVAHGNADVERSLSVSKKILTPERTCLSEACLNGLRLSRDVVTLHGKVTDVPVTKELLSSVRQAHKKYIERTEAEKMEILQKENKRDDDKKESTEKAQERKRKVKEKEKDVKRKENELKEDLKRANEVFNEANERLSAAIKANDFKELNIAQSLLAVAKTDMKKATESLEKCREQRDEIDKRRRRMIDVC